MVISENSSDKKPDKKEKPSTKVVIRRLPPNIDQETFRNQVSPLPDYSYIYTVKGDLSLGENAFSRVYINFVYPDDVYSFKERFDNYVFLDNRTGHEYPAVVEFAPFQKIPKKRGKRTDPKSGSIETDPVYLDFVESLNKPEQQDEKPEYTLQLNMEDKTDKNDVTTPLLEFIKNKRAQKLKIREMRREERERKRREFENRKKDYPRGYDVRKYDEKSSAKGLKSHGSKVALTKSEEKTGGESGDGNSKTKSDKLDNNLTTTNKPDNSNTKPKPYENKPASATGYGNKNRDRDRPEQRATKKDIKPRFPKKDYDHVNNSTKRSNEGYGTNKKSFEDAKNKNKEENSTTKPGCNQNKKVKKYSERREERKIEAQKAELRRLEQTNKEKESIKEKDITITTKGSSSESQIKSVICNKETVGTKVKEAQKTEESTTQVVEKTSENTNKKANEENTESKEEKKTTENNNNTVENKVKVIENKESAKSTSAEEADKDLGSGSSGDSGRRKHSGSGAKEKESESARRIRNKDRPTIAIYRPGMLSKRKQNDDDPKS